MKLNLEIELDWIDDEMNIDETVKQNVIDTIVSKIQKKVEGKVQTKIDEIIDKTIVDNINKKTDDLFNDFLGREVSVSDNYGSVIKVYENVEAIVKEKFDNFMTQTVDDQGRSTESSYGNKHKRLTFIISKQLQDFADKFTTDAVKQVSSEIQLHVKDGLTTKLGKELMSVLKVEKMLGLPEKS